MSYSFILLISLGVCFAGQFLALRSVGGRTTKSESGFFSSIARIQTGIQGDPKVMLLGSSMTGRFPEQNAGFKGVANLGCDGGSALDTLRAIDEGLLPTAPLLIIEGNTFYRGRSESQTETSKAIRSLWFQVGVRFPLLGATARPTSFLYSKLLARRIGNTVGPNGPPLSTTSKPALIQKSGERHPQNLQVIADIAPVLNRLTSKGIQICIVILPTGKPTTERNLEIAKALAADGGIPYWDLTEGLAPGSVAFTDGIHMAPETAAATLRTMLSELPYKPD